MSNIAEFKRPEKTEPHLVGNAHCVQCRHQWEAVAPVGAIFLECPECHTNKGLFTNHVEPEGDRWACNCNGCQLFFVSKRGAQCMNCGVWQTF